MDIHFDVKGARQVGLRFDAFPDDLYQDLKGEIGALSKELFARVEAATPSRTGRLRSEERVRLFADANRISGYVDIEGAKGSQDFAKAGAEEYGAHNARGQLKAHPMKLDHYWSQKLNAPVTVMVAAHSRPPNVAEVAFERGPLAAMQPEILARLNAVVERRVALTNA